MYGKWYCMRLCMFALIAACCCWAVVPAQADPVADWHSIERAVRNGTMTSSAAQARMKDVVARLRSSYALTVAGLPERWVFPVQGYSSETIRRKDFKAAARYRNGTVRKYDFFAGNQHRGAHPAYDIPIRDTNRDAMDDRSGAPVNVVAMTPAVVVSVCREWPANRQLQGGNYAWLYNPDADTFFYYAHLNTIEVEDGALLAPGDVIGTVGRSGVAAARASSKTHLHLMVLRYGEGKFTPVDYYSRIE